MDNFSEMLLQLTYDVLMGDYEAALVDAAAFNSEEGDAGSLRAALLDLFFNDDGESVGLSDAQISAIVDAAGVTAYVYHFYLRDLKKITRLTRDTFVKSQAYQYAVVDENPQFYDAPEKESFFRVLSTCAIRLRKPDIIKAILDRLKALQAA